MPFLAEFLTIATIHLLAVMSPGPDFVLISRNSLMYSKKTAIYSALGLALGILVHITYSLVGIGFIIASSVVLFSIMKFLSAGYLIYIGYKCIRSKPQRTEPGREIIKEQDLGRSAAIRMGFLTNVFNPKVTMFFFALFTQVINPQTPLSVQILYGLEMSVMTFIWFATVAVILSNQHIKKRFHSIHYHLEKVFGVILIALGIKVALSSSK
jgi:RhtB (resistance to homoserine/threonine) family protein